MDCVPLTDKYLLEDFNRDICRTIMRICTGAGAEGAPQSYRRLQEKPQHCLPDQGPRGVSE